MFFREKFKLGEIKNLIDYKYTAFDSSILQNVLYRALFIRLQRLIPASVMPNHLTVAGFFAMVLSFVLTLAFDPSLMEPLPILSIANCMLLVFYFSMDNLDGIHARATRMCSPLGNILDHVVDSFCCMTVGVTLASSMRIGMGNLFILLLATVHIIFYLGVLYQRYVGVFVFWPVSGCVEGLTFVMAVHVLSACGVQLNSLLATRLAFVPSFGLENALGFCVWATLLYNIAHVSVTVYRGLHSKKFLKYIISLYQVFLITLLFSSGFYYIDSSLSTERWLFLAIFSVAFTLCYTEETLSMILKRDVDKRVIVVAFVSIAAAVIIGTSGGNRVAKLTAVFVAVLSLFALKVSSIISNICKGCNCQFLRRK